ncbi:phage baseplate assembly protein V, partial [Helicobacter sp. T3_23-1059]
MVGSTKNVLFATNKQCKTTPRVGDEVLISFLDNDIDKPYISGSLYNNTNTLN